MKKKIFLAVLSIGLLSAAAVYYYVFIYSANHRRSAEDEQCIVVSAADLVKQYQSSEATANAKFLDKALQVTGVVGEVKKDPTGNTTVTIKSDDAFAGVFCTLKKTETTLPVVGSTIVVKGFCKGFLSDVVITDAVLKNN